MNNIIDWFLAKDVDDSDECEIFTRKQMSFCRVGIMFVLIIFITFLYINNGY